MARKRSREKCYYCGTSGKRLTRDHFIPRDIGGMDEGNIVLACEPCNHEKGSRIPSIEETRRFIRIHGHYPGYEQGKFVLGRFHEYAGKRVAAADKRIVNENLRLAAAARVEKMCREATIRLWSMIELGSERAVVEIEQQADFYLWTRGICV